MRGGLLMGAPAAAFRLRSHRVARKVLATLFAAVLVACHGGAASAQSTEDVDVRTRQSKLFEELSADPGNLDLMFAYAVTSLQAEDYEAAISTLERMLFFNPKLSRVKLELAVAYYRLGVYDVARFHFQEVLDGDPPPEVAERIQPFLAQIDDRTARQSVSGYVEVGGVYSSNANLGPPDREVNVEFFPGGVGLISAEDDEADDFGARVTASVTHSYDLRRADDSAWVTSLDYSGVRYREETTGNIDALFAATGPRLAVDDEAFGMKARPFVAAGFVRAGGEALYAAGTGGLEISESLTPTLSAFGSASLEWREFFNGRDDFNGLYGAGYAGLSITPGRNRSYGAALVARTDRTAEPFTSNFDVGARASASRLVDFSEESELFLFRQPWRFSAYAQASSRFFDAPDPAVDADKTRRDVDVRVGGRVLAPLAENIAAAADVSYYRRTSNIQNFELRNLEVGLSLVHAF